MTEKQYFEMLKFLHEGELKPLELHCIHPFDLYEMINAELATKPVDVIDLGTVFLINGKAMLPTTAVTPKTPEGNRKLEAWPKVGFKSQHYAYLEVVCPTCGAGVGLDCVTRPGQTPTTAKRDGITYAHPARLTAK